MNSNGYEKAPKAKLGVGAKIAIVAVIVIFLIFVILIILLIVGAFTVKNNVTCSEENPSCPSTFTCNFESNICVPISS